MVDNQEFQMNGVSQIKIHTKWVWITVVATIVFLMITGPMLYFASTARPATVNSGGFTQGEDW